MDGKEKRIDASELGKSCRYIGSNANSVGVKNMTIRIARHTLLLIISGQDMPISRQR